MLNPNKSRQSKAKREVLVRIYCMLPRLEIETCKLFASTSNYVENEKLLAAL